MGNSTAVDVRHLILPLATCHHWMSPLQRTKYNLSTHKLLARRDRKQCRKNENDVDAAAEETTKVKTWPKKQLLSLTCWPCITSLNVLRNTWSELVWVLNEVQAVIARGWREIRETYRNLWICALSICDCKSVTFASLTLWIGDLWIHYLWTPTRHTCLEQTLLYWWWDPN